MEFAKCVEKQLGNQTFTENGAVSNKSSFSYVLDYFSKCGSLRGNDEEAIELFKAAYDESPMLARKILFYSRDIRGGTGERDTFRSVIKYLAKEHPADIIKNLKNIPEFGRWDDLYSLVDTNIESVIFEFMHEQLLQDEIDMNNGKAISLLGKWLKSENTSSEISKKLAKVTRCYFRMTSKEYRQRLSKLRAYINIVESKMSSGDWDSIKYENVPSRAMKLYTKSFTRHDEERFSSYLKDVANGKKKINAGTLYPYDIISRFLNKEITEDEEKTYELLWKNLPNYFEDGEYNTLAVIDVSGSMFSSKASIKPIEVAISLGLYMAEKNKGKLHDYFMTFSENPVMVKIKGDTLKDKIKNISNAEWGCNTDLMKLFDLLLKTIIANKIPQEEIPKKIFIISDMQFDVATKSNKTTFEKIDEKFKKYKIKRPDLVFWNVNAKSDVPVLKDDNGTFLVSGASPSILSHALNTKSQTPYEFMIEVLTSERYSSIL